ncbi:MAG: aminomethyl-transferring glycine dehydrogenase subunit GcvPB [Candidatus Aureabacteria bacterium]|nr:aminomethyl-transferring glycine dehydrogenase subunit GcvPB [Candidatus Auribacterota bacterium]
MKVPLSEQLLFEKAASGSGQFSAEHSLLNREKLVSRVPSFFLRKNEIGLPELSERDLVMHYTRLAGRMFSVDSHFYPLGSCTMKYNPKISEDVSSEEGFQYAHPFQNEDDVQGCLQMMHELEQRLNVICGMDAFTLQPSAGAHGELTALLIARKYFKDRKEERIKVVVPDSSHGTNPASASLCGFHVVTIPSLNGEVDMAALERECTSDLAVFMLTNPNTAGLFEKNIVSICEKVHSAGGLTYYDGANLNALMGIARPGDMGFDLLHVNLHKTMATPHGGGGPGSGPVGVKAHLVSYLPVPFVEKKKDDVYKWSYKRPGTIGMMKSFWGNFGVALKAAVYCDALGFSGLKQASLTAVLNANYLKKKLEDTFTVPFNELCMHEFVMTPHPEKSPAKTLDMAKRLLDFGIHAPTVYFPLTVKESMMIEPTETESKDTLDEFVSVMMQIADEARNQPEKLHDAPLTTYRQRLDEVRAARNPVLKYGDPVDPA